MFATGAWLQEATVTTPESPLTDLPVACAVAFIASPDTSAGEMPDLVHVPPDTGTVAPRATLFLNTWMLVPSASVLVPETLVAPMQIGELTVGAAVCGAAAASNAPTRAG